MRDRLRYFRSRYVAFAHDVAMIPMAWLGAYWLRFNLDAIPSEFLAVALAMLPVVMLVQGATFWYFGLYRGVWRFASLPDLLRIVQAVVIGVALSALAIFLIARVQGIPRAVFPLSGLLLVALLGGPRFLYRWFKDRETFRPIGRKALIVGAGKAGEMLVRDLLRDPVSTYYPTAFVDDDRKKVGRDIHGVRVVGVCDDIPRIVERYGVDLIILALPSISGRRLRRIVEICERSGVSFRTLPRMQDLVNGQVSLKELRNVEIEDLLGREKVTLDWRSIEGELTGKSVMVTGGGGSIGTELCRQIARLSPSRLVVYEQSEYNLYSIDRELRGSFPDLALASVLADMGDPVAVDRVLNTYRPQVIFHAAAYKHVPLLEEQARAATINNVLGTEIIAAAAARHRCESFVLISSDKAVNPANIMGMTKRVAEIICQAWGTRSDTRFVTVRFGNVLGSAGSVIPLFQRQIETGGPVTVTHPEITRYFMTIPEACQLILQASAIGRGGEIYVLDMGEPVKIAYLAEQLILLSGKKPGEDVEIVYTGLRPGEKLYEELFHDRERLDKTPHSKILLAHPRQVNPVEFDQALSELRVACDQADEEAIKDILWRLVPEHVGWLTPAAKGEDVTPPGSPSRQEPTKTSAGAPL
jgi:FlaA1/EpsC-like NDP-sugar epimerase